ncbi:peptidoglycan endopeptidase, partial [Pseudomonas sp. 5B4]|nr:peptidoglycan endopeptidase [Pseudomonas sp. 5B4]
MRPIFKTWQTICLLMTLAAHATNREQQIPPSFNGFTAKTHSSPTPAYTAATATIHPTAPTRTSHRHTLKHIS